jgi:hypothetical protein
MENPVVPLVIHDRTNMTVVAYGVNNTVKHTFVSKDVPCTDWHRDKRAIYCI